MAFGQDATFSDQAFLARQLERGRHAQRHVWRGKQQAEAVHFVRPVTRITAGQRGKQLEAAGEQRQAERPACCHSISGEGAAEAPQGEHQDDPRQDLQAVLHRHGRHAHRRRELAHADVQREHERRLVGLRRKRVVDQPARLLGALAHGGLVLGEVVDEPSRSQARGARRRAAGSDQTR